MDFYFYLYSGSYNHSIGQFTATGISPPENTHSVPDGVYQNGDPISITQYTDSEVVGVINGTFIGYSINGFMIEQQVGDDTTHMFFSNYSTVPLNDPFTITTNFAYAICYMAGTLIATPAGEVAVETLTIGDVVLTASGETRAVRWIGRQTVTRMFADPLRSYPVRILAGAFDDNLPKRDLYVSPDHALLVDGLLVQANALVNGTSIARIERPEERFTYFHIELEDHALLLAEGTPAETFVDNVTRRRFDNYAEFEALYGKPSGIKNEIDLPRVKSVRQLPAHIARRLAERAGRRAA